MEKGLGYLTRLRVSQKIKKSFRRRWFYRLLFLFLLTLLTIVSPLRDVLIKKVLTTQISVQLGEDVWIPELKTTLWPLQLQVRGLQIGDTGQSYIQVQQLDIDVQIQEDRPWIRRIEVQQPIVVLPFDEKGLIPFRKRVRGGTPMTELPFEELNIYDASLAVEYLDIRARVSEVYLQYFEGKGHFIASPEPFRIRERDVSIKPLSFDFQYTPGNFSIDMLSVDVEGLNIQGFIRAGAKVESRFDIQGIIPEILRGKKIHLEGELDTTCTITKDQDGLDIVLDGVSHQTELHRLLRSGIRDFLPFEDLEHRVRWHDGNIVIEELRTPFADGMVMAVGGYSPTDDFLSLDIQMDGLPLWRLGQDMRLSSSPWVDGILDGTLTLEGSLRNLELSGPLNLEIQQLITATGSVQDSPALIRTPFLTLVGEADITRTNLRINKTVLEAGPNKAILDYFIQWGADPKTDILVDFSHLVLDSLRPLADMNFVGAGTAQLHLWGVPKAYSFTLSTDVYEFGLLGFNPVDRFQGEIVSPNLRDWTFQNLSLKEGETTMLGELEIDFRSKVLKSHLFTTKGRIEDLIPIFFDFSGLTGLMKGDVTLEGPFQDLDIVSKMSLEEPILWGESFSEGEFSLHMKKKFLTVDQFVLRKDDRDIYVRGSMNEEKELNFEAYGNRWDISELDMVRSLSLPLQGDVQFYALIKGDSVRPKGSIQFLNMTYNDIALGDGTLSFSSDRGSGLLIDGGFPDVGVSYQGKTQTLSISDNYSCSIDLRSFPAHVFYPKTRTGEPIFMSSSGELHIESYGQEFFMEASLSDFDVRVRDRLLYLRKPASVSFQSNELSLSGVEFGDGNKTKIQISGGKTFTGELDYQLFGTVDLAYVPPLIGLVDRSSGIAEVKGTLQGDPSAPIPQFDIRIVDGYFSASWWDHPYEEVVGRLFVSPYRYEINNWKGRMGGGDLFVGGVVASDYFSVRQLDLNLDLNDGQVQVISYLPPIRGDADLRLVGTMDSLLMKGGVRISNMLFSKRIEWEDAMISIDSTFLEEAAKRDLGSSWLSFDVDITAEDTVRIRNNLADITASANFQIIGDLNRIGTIGSLKAQSGGRVLLKERDFEVQRAEIRFLEPYSYDPELDISLFTRVRSIDEVYDINYYVEGLYSKWKFRSNSNPPLQQADINALLFFGMTRAELERMGGLSNTLAVEGTDLLASKFRNVIGFDEVGEGVFQADFLSFDRFDLISGTSSSGAFSSSLRLLAEKDLASGSRLRLEKDLTQTEDFYFSFEQKLANTFYLRSFWTSEQRNRYLDIGGAYGVEFQLRLEAD